MGNYILLERVKLNASAASVTFANIPQTGYTDLKIVMSLRSTDTASNSGYYDPLLTRFNNSTSNYSGREIYAYQNTPYSGTLTTATSTIAGGTWGRLTGVGVNNSNSSATASTFTSIDLYLPNYTSSNYKSYSFDLAEEQNASYSTLGMTAGLWSDTTAISTIAFALKDGSFTQYSTFSLYGLAAVGTTPVIAPKATGGNKIDYDGTYWIHTFTSSGTFTPIAPLTCDYLVVAGGGGGGRYKAGGGGAGGLRSTVTATGGGGALETPLSLSSNTAYTVTIGAGGQGGINAGGGAQNGVNGSDSTFATITSLGGGYGGGAFSSSNSPGNTGGSGGGGGANNLDAGGAGTANQGFAGATAVSGQGGGGGGAGEAGNTDGSGQGGDGVAVAITGTLTTYAGGGGGGGNSGSKAGGDGGGGAGGDTNNAVVGTVNTGGGGGGGAGDNGGEYAGRAGGSGIVIIRYAV